MKNQSECQGDEWAGSFLLPLRNYSIWEPLEITKALKTDLLKFAKTLKLNGPPTNKNYNSNDFLTPTGFFQIGRAHV